MENENQIKNLISLCDELTTTKMLFADQKINKILEAIAECPEVYELLSECMNSFNKAKEFDRAFTKDSTGKKIFVMPKEEQQAPVNNIFASLRINPFEEEQKQNDTFVSPTSEEKEPKQEETYPNILGSIPVQNTPTQEQLNTGIYDLRFAINNVRQAVQNTEKFGFKIETQEFDFDNVYQIVIKIDKNK